MKRLEQMFRALIQRKTEPDNLIVEEFRMLKQKAKARKVTPESEAATTVTDAAEPSQCD